MEKDNINRRDFLKSSVKTIAAGTLIYSAIDLERLLAFSKETENISSIQKVINLSDYPALGSTGGYAMITGTVIVIRTGQKSFAAIKTVCTHKKCDVEFNGTEFECPCHGSKFSKSGKVLNGPAKKNLTSYKTSFDAEKNTLTVNM